MPWARLNKRPVWYLTLYRGANEELYVIQAQVQELQASVIIYSFFFQLYITITRKTELRTPDQLVPENKTFELEAIENWGDKNNQLQMQFQKNWLKQNA